MFIEKLSKSQFNKLCSKLFGFDCYMGSINEVEHKGNTFTMSCEMDQDNNLVFEHTLIINFNDFYAEQEEIERTFTGKRQNVVDISSEIHEFMIKRFGMDYINEYAKFLEKQKIEKIEKIEEENKEKLRLLIYKFNKKEELKNKQAINELTKQENKKSKDIIQEILNKFENDLNRFPTTKEKVEYLKSLGFDVKSKYEENSENLEK